MAALVAALLCLLLLAAAEAEIGSKCSSNVECTRNVQHSECKNGECQCREYLVPTKNKARCLHGVGLNYACEDDGQCIDPHTSCIQEHRYVMCKCNPGFIPHNKTCLPVVRLQGSCKVKEQCTENAECQDSVCLCAGFSLPRDGLCLLEKDEQEMGLSTAVRRTFHMGLICLLIGLSFL